MLGLWQALAAEAGTDPKKQTLQDIRAAHGTLSAYEVYLAAKAAGRLQWGRRAVAGAIVLLLAGIAATWWAPATAPAPSAYVKVTYGHAVACGAVQLSGARLLHLIIYNTHEIVIIPFSQITNLATTATCP